MKVFKRGGFIILDQAGVEAPIPIPNFDYQIISSTVKIRDLAEQTGYSSTVANIQDANGAPVGNAAAIATYFSILVNVSTVASGGASSANQLLEIVQLQAINASTAGAATEANQALIRTELQTIVSFQLLLSNLMQAIQANTSQSNYTKALTHANDLVQTYTWLDAGTADQRISTIVYSSSVIPSPVTKTFTYNGGPGTYHVATSTLT